MRALHCCFIAALAVSSAVVGVARMNAQKPTQYTVVSVNSMFGEPQQTTVYRDGNKAMLVYVPAAKAADPKATRSHNLYDLARGKTRSWSAPAEQAGCGVGNFSGDWGDPFAGLSDLAGPNPKVVGTETVLGIAATIVEAQANGTNLRAWYDTKTGLVLKVNMAQGSDAMRTVIEVKKVSLGAPPANVFVPPAECAAVPEYQTDAEKIAAMTGKDASLFSDASHGPGSGDSCTMNFKVVQAGTLALVRNPYQIAIDLTYDPNNPTPPSYSFGVGQNGHSTFSGGQMHEMTSQLRNGELRVPNIPATFEMDLAMGDAGWTGGLMYRHCMGPVTTLLYVMKNPAKTSDGGYFLWEKP